MKGYLATLKDYYPSTKKEEDPASMKFDLENVSEEELISDQNPREKYLIGNDLFLFESLKK